MARYALIIAGGSGTRLWPMSTKARPKQLIKFINGRSLLQIAVDRLEGLIPNENIYICAGQDTRQAILDGLPGFDQSRFIGEPTGRDTLNAVALGTGVIGLKDCEATVAVFTADHLIEPVDQFQKIVSHGCDLAEAKTDTLVTFGIAPTRPATGFGYLQLADPITLDGDDENGPAAKAFAVDQFKEKPDQTTAEKYLQAGPDFFLWNSGMFVWRASTLMQCVERFAPENFAELAKVFGSWGTDQQASTLDQVYPTLIKISVDYAIMEPASQAADIGVAAVPMPLTWLDVGSWPSFAQTCDADDAANCQAGGPAVHLDSSGCVTVTDDHQHLIATLGCDDLIIVRTDSATLVCKKDRAEDIKQLHGLVGDKLGETYL